MAPTSRVKQNLALVVGNSVSSMSRSTESFLSPSPKKEKRKEKDQSGRW
jgi:hypothetical protein